MTYQELLNAYKERGERLWQQEDDIAKLAAENKRLREALDYIRENSCEDAIFMMAQDSLQESSDE